MIERIAVEALATYIIACVVGGASIFAPIRNKVEQVSPRLKIGNHPHFIECRLCLSFWAALAVTIYNGNVGELLPVYGAAYFLATQER